jgi:alanyl-tRNA synthetase
LSQEAILSKKKYPSAHVRQMYLDFFKDRGHTIVPSMSLVPGGDETLLFTNSGMVQFKGVFLGTEKLPYVRAADSQKCMRVAGKHNDLDDVGRDNRHHTFFEMLGNWSFGDYYKAEAIEWAWELLTAEWDLPKDKLYVTCFEDELGQIPRDDEAAEAWVKQPGFIEDHVLFFGRSENFWEMADTGPCGPDSEIHIDRGIAHCNLLHIEGHECKVNGDCDRYLELWNLVFIQYDRKDADTLNSLPMKHVDTGMGFDRMVSVLQDTDSTYRTDLFSPLIDSLQQLAGHSDKQVAEHWTPYRVIADHARAMAFLIADGVVPGNVGRNYVTRMIVRRASLFGGKIGFDEPFLAEIADRVIDHYGDAYPELPQKRSAILDAVTEEEKQFQRTVDLGISHLMELIEETKDSGERLITGTQAFNVYQTRGLPFEIIRDIAREYELEVDHDGFNRAMDEHRKVSRGAGVDFSSLNDEVDGLNATPLYQALLENLRGTGKLPDEGVQYDPYTWDDQKSELLALIRDGELVTTAEKDEMVGVILPSTSFYVEAGGQVSDTGRIDSENWAIDVHDTREALTGLIVHYGRVLEGRPKVGDQAKAAIDASRRWDIMRNHTATHLLHAGLRKIVGNKAEQAGSLVAPDRLRFDFNSTEALNADQISQIEKFVNEAILSDHMLSIEHTERQKAVKAGAIALFGENYGDVVRTVTIDDISYELCGGTHVSQTGVIGAFLIVSEGSVAANVRRIEAVSGHGALDYIGSKRTALRELAETLRVPETQALERLNELLNAHSELQERLRSLSNAQAKLQFEALQPTMVDGIPVVTGIITGVKSDALRSLADHFRELNETGILVLASAPEQKPVLVAMLTDDLVARGLDAVELAQDLGKEVGGSGGGKPNLAQAGGIYSDKLEDALALVPKWVERHLG